MEASIDVREATANDLAAVLRLYAQPDFDDGDVLPVAEANVILARMATYPWYRLYVATLSNVVVGTFALLVMDNLGHMGRPSAIVEDVAVEPSVQGRGIGRAMMRHAADTARARGCYKLVLSSSVERTGAHAFYDSLGFVRHGYSFTLDLEPSRRAAGR